MRDEPEHEALVFARRGETGGRVCWRQVVVCGRHLRQQEEAAGVWWGSERGERGGRIGGGGTQGAGKGDGVGGRGGYGLRNGGCGCDDGVVRSCRCRARGCGRVWGICAMHGNGGCVGRGIDKGWGVGCVCSSTYTVDFMVRVRNAAVDAETWSASADLRRDGLIEGEQCGGRSCFEGCYDGWTREDMGVC